MSIEDKKHNSIDVDGMLAGSKPVVASKVARRNIVKYTLIFCAFCVLFIMFTGKDTSIYNTIVVSCFSLAGTTIATYCFSGAYQDMNTERVRMITEAGRKVPGDDHKDGQGGDSQ